MLFYLPSLQATKNHCPLIWPATIGPYFLRGGDGIGGAIILLTSKTKKSNQHTGKHTTKPKNYQHITTSQTQNKPFRQFSAIAAFKPCPSFCPVCPTATGKKNQDLPGFYPDGPEDL